MTLNKIIIADKSNYRSVELGRSVLKQILETRYPLTSTDEFKRLLSQKIEDGMRVYWHEILGKCHMSSVSGLKRTLDWIDSIERADGNFILFCSSLRGLMESAGDTYYGLNAIALSLAKMRATIEKALTGTLSDLAISQELEDRLIHFTHASKEAAKIFDKSFEPESAKTCVSRLNQNSKIDFYELYSFLCEVTHPASTSLAFNFTEDNGVLIWDGKKDSELISILLNRDQAMIDELLMRSFNPIFLLMKTLNLFSNHDFRIPSADELNLDKVPAWQMVKMEFQN